MLFDGTRGFVSILAIVRLGHQLHIDITTVGSHLLDTRTSRYIGGLIACMRIVSDLKTSD